nr:hypothetical protein [Tanacetum cinerariifolium]
EQIDQNDEDVDLAKERELLASLIAKLKCEIDETKNRNTLLETSNKVLVEKLKNEIADFKNKNRSLTEANNKLSEVIKDDGWLGVHEDGLAWFKFELILTLIEAARTMLADSLLPISFWTEAVNTACYVQNRVLVTKPHNKTPYELLHGRTPSIGFMRPIGCPVTILNTFDPLGKFKRKTLHVNFLENKPNIAGSGPTWLFDIDSLTRTMNYQPVTAGNQSNPSAGFQDKFDAEKAGEEVNQEYMLFPVWSFGSSNPQNKDGDAAFDGKEHEVDTKKPESVVNVSSSDSAQPGEQDDKTKKKDKGKSSVESFTGNRDLSAEFEDHSDNNSNDVNAAGFIVPTAGQNSSNSTNPFSDAGPLNTIASPTYGKYSFKDASQLPDNPDMEDITYSDHENVGAEADFNNFETFITVSPIPTTRTHKDHPVSQIIGDLSSTTQTRSMTRMIKDQGFEDPDHPDKVYKVVKALYGLHQAPRACDYAGASLDRKSTTRGCQFLGCKLISWQCKKQTVVATSSTEAEYVSNDVTRLQALVDRKKVVITEAAIRDVLSLDDAERVDCLPNEEIFAELARMGYEKPVETPLFEGMLVAGEPKEQGDAEEQVQGNDNDAAQGADTAVLGDDEVLDAYATLTRQVEHFEHDKVAQALEITMLKKRVKKLEKANKVKVSKLRRLKKVGTSKRIESSDDIDMEDASNQGRTLADLDRDEGIALMDDKGAKKKVEDA